MSTCTRINEKTAGVVDVKFKDADRVLQAPISLRYRVDCLDAEEDDREIRDWTDHPGPMASTIRIQLTSSDQTIKVPTLKEERHRVLVNANYGTDDELYAEEIYIVKNLTGVT